MELEGKKILRGFRIAVYNNMMTFGGKLATRRLTRQKTRYETANNYSIEQALDQQA